MLTVGLGGGGGGGGQSITRYVYLYHSYPAGVSSLFISVSYNKLIEQYRLHAGA